LIEVVHVAPDSSASRLGIKRGDRLLSINGREIRDVIDYQFLVADERLSLSIEPKGLPRKNLIVTKDPDDTLGIECEPPVVRRCRNKCIFCFVDQTPPGCRKSLYVKDDDYRASFLHGNYITLGNLSEDDWSRIFSQRLSPLYVSVHATDRTLRSRILNNKRAPHILSQLRRLAQGGIRIHAQIVLCPGVNDGPHLLKTVHDLAGLFPSVSSVAVVPVGLTAHRAGLYPLRTFTRKEARAAVEALEETARTFLKTFGTRLVFASDEFYITAGMAVPGASWYEDFPQLENGVGMVAQFLREAARTRLPLRVPPKQVSLVTGESFAPILGKLVRRLKAVTGLSPRLITAQNRFFGAPVSVAGLLTGQDILSAAKGKRLGSMLVIPSATLREDEDVFLDGMDRPLLERTLGVRVVSAGGFRDLIDIIRR
jgi:putative radical SAM enzyme (TIGR03279 family)